MGNAAAPFRRVAEGIDIFVRLTPKSGRDALEGLETTDDGRSHLRARVRAAPEKGRANKALERLVADRLSVAPGTVAVVAGHTGRLKTLRVTAGGAEAARIAGLLAAWPEGAR